MAAFESILDTLASAIDSRRVLGAVCTTAMSLADASVAAIALVGADMDFRIETCVGSPDEAWRDFSATIGSGFIGQTIDSCVTRSTADYAADVRTGLYLGADATEVIPGADLRWAVAAPLMVRGDALGALITGGPQVRQPELKLGETLQTIARQVALALDMSRLLDAARDQAFHAELLNSITKDLRGQLDSTSVVVAASASLGKALSADRCVVLLDSDETQSFEIAADHRSAALAPLEDDAETLGAVGRLLASVDSDDWTGVISSDAETQRGRVSLMATPIAFGGEEVGALVAVSAPGTRTWAPAETRLIERAADEVGRAIGHARLFESESRAVTRLRELDQMKNEFVSVVSHELRTPLTSIKGFTATLLENDEEYGKDERTRFLGIIQRQADRLERLIGDFLDVSRLQQGALGLAYERVNVIEIATDCMRFLASDAAEAGRQIVVEGDETTIEGDREKVAQILTNLVSNSIKYGAGQITVSVAESEAGVTTVVADEGRGIPADEAARIFEKFFQAEQGSTRRSKGVGLGLAIVKGLVEAHGGRVWYESGEERGARFCFFLPRVVPDSIREQNMVRTGRTDLLLG